MMIQMEKHVLLDDVYRRVYDEFLRKLGDIGHKFCEKAHDWMWKLIDVICEHVELNIPFKTDYR